MCLIMMKLASESFCFQPFNGITGRSFAGIVMDVFSLLLKPGEPNG